MPTKKFNSSINLQGNSLQQAGFEVLSELPEKNLFPGLEVFINQKYIYNGFSWSSQTNPIPALNLLLPVDEINVTELTNKSFEIPLKMGQNAQIPNFSCGLFSCSLFDDLIFENESQAELLPAGSSDWIQTNIDDIKNLYKGDKYRISVIKDSLITENPFYLANKRPGLFEAIYLNNNPRQFPIQYTIETLMFANLIGDADYTNINNYRWVKIYEKTHSNSNCLWIFPLHQIIAPYNSNLYAYNIRITYTIVGGTGSTAGGDSQIYKPTLLTSRNMTISSKPILINFDASVAPTQNNTTKKELSWILQYYAQSVNWLKLKLETLENRVVELENRLSNNS